MEMRTCTKCGEEKPFTAEYFYRNRSKALGYSVWCKICYCKRSKKYREENPEKVRAGQKKYREQNREKMLDRSKKWREEKRQKEYSFIPPNGLGDMVTAQWNEYWSKYN